MTPPPLGLDHGDGWMVRKLKAGNERALLWAFRRERLMYAMAGGAIAVAVATLPFLPRAFLPPFNEGTLTISLRFQPGISLAEQMQQRLSGVAGLRDLQIERQVRVPQLQVTVNHERAALHGVSAATIGQAVQDMSGGQVVSEVVDGACRFDLVMRLADQERTGSGLSSIMIETPGGRVPLSLLAEVRDTDGPNQILRENGRRRIVALANTDGSDTAAIVQRIRAEMANAPLPPGYFFALEGTFQAQEEATRLIAMLSLVSLTLIFMVLYSRYRSAVLALIIMGNVPLALVGAIAVLWIAGQPLSVASMIGFITLAGVAARNGILKVSHYLNLARLEGEPWGLGLVVRGSLERLTPVLMTALSAGFALIPLMIGANEPGKEILHPVAVTIFGGLVTATLLDTFLTPLLFHRFGRPALASRMDRQQEMKVAEAY